MTVRRAHRQEYQMMADGKKGRFILGLRLCAAGIALFLVAPT